VQPLKSTLTEHREYSGEERIHLAAIIPYLYVHNNPAGTFNLTVSGPYGQVCSINFNAAEIKTALQTADDYFHVYYPLIPTNHVKIEAGSYDFILSASGYVYSSTSFIGWIQQHEDIQTSVDYTPINDSQNPLTLRIKAYKEGIL
jgi:hypothetical protein